MKFRENISLAKYSHYKIGGPARFFFESKNERETAWALREAKARRLSVFVLGGGTNVLLPDSGFDGLVIRPVITGMKSGRKNTIEAGAGVPMEKLLAFAAGRSLAGLEWAGGLPGTLGGAVRGNAGCFGGEMKDVVVSVRSIDPRTTKIVERSAKACAFSYRESVFKQAGRRGAAGEIIIGATLALAPGNRREILRSVREKIEHRQRNHPLEHPNIGSIFKNVPLASVCRSKRSFERAVAVGVLEFRGSRFSVKTDPVPVISAAKLISESGLRGVSFGGAMISAKHPNFIVNALGAESRDVKTLMSLAKLEVRRKFGVSLDEEVQTV